ncbi:MAG: hypothetical protein DI539_03940 [Flavobacterium psychrophilum]|nr:MAG: hypothetical protein DI539_03940 [Flavobacterium psychrophilum]
MTPEQVIEKILLGGLLGLLGQGIRMAIGLKKLSDTNAQRDSKEELNTGRLMVSLFIGFVAGALYVLVNGFSNQPDVENGEYIGNQFVFTVIAAGYAGSDFIEGLFNTYMAKMPTAGSGNTGTTVTGTNPVVVAPANTADTAVVVNQPPADTPPPAGNPQNDSGIVANPA